jgi:predicted lipoprotein with Yx(FWY)xxD motif
MRTKLVACTFALAVALTACGSYGSNDSETVSKSDDAAPAAESATPAAEGATPADAGQTVGQTVQVVQTALGEILASADGLSLYGFTNDTAGVPTCEGACAETWPALLVDGPELPADLDPNVFRVVPRADGTFQLAAGAWPLYAFSGDGAPGETNGQGSGGVWYLVTPTGGLLRGDDAPDPVSPPQEGDADYGS